jgi:DNA-binding NtrC family response regulator
MRRVLVIGGGAEGEAVASCIGARGYEPVAAATSALGLRLHREEGSDLVLLLLPLPDAGGRACIGRLLRQDPRAIVIVSGRDDEIRGAPEALEHGAFDYLSHAHEAGDQLLAVIGVALGARKSDAQLRFLRRKDASDTRWETIVGECPAMRAVFATVRQICQRTASGVAPTVLIVGETGTGKGLIAKALHYNGSRRSNAFVDINCAAIAPSLIESELFGHTRGAFTDAKTDRAGLIETADGGTLFLDEVGALPLELQGKLLTVLEEKTVRRVGASQGIPVNVQVIAAQNELQSRVARGAFRPDLYHRLDVLRIALPPLRERGADCLLLGRTFVRSLCLAYGLPEKRLGESALRAIERHSWPGNVRELRNQIERIVTLEEGDEIRAEHFHLGGARVEIERPEERSLEVRLPEGGCPLALLEREVIRQALAMHGGNVSRTARYLAISRYTLIYRIKKHRLGDAVASAPDDE